MSEEIVSLIPKLFTIIEKVRQEEAKKESEKPGSLYLLGAFRHEYENSHSEIIANLLDPNGTHKHGDEFLRMFLNQVVFESKKDELEIIKDLNSTIVIPEFFIRDDIKNGRIDILLEHKEFIVIIENKIWAKDQEEQLRRYYDAILMQNKLLKDKILEDNIHVVYLTPDGRDPSENSFGKNDVAGKRLRDKCICISYKIHIIKWLENVYAELDLVYKKEPLLISGIEQYLHAIKAITNQLEEDNAMKDKLFQEIVKIKQYGDLQNLFESVNAAKEIYPLLKVYEHFENNESISNLYFTRGQNHDEHFKIADLQTNDYGDWVSLYIILNNNIQITFWRNGVENSYYRLYVGKLPSSRKSLKDEIRKIMAPPLKDDWEDWEDDNDKTGVQADQYRSNNIDEDAISKVIAKIEKLIEYSLKN